MKTRDFDSVEYLTSESKIAAYLRAAAEHNDDHFYSACLAQVARARAINELAESTGFERNAVFEMLSSPENIVRLRTCLVDVVPNEVAELVQV